MKLIHFKISEEQGIEIQELTQELIKELTLQDNCFTSFHYSNEISVITKTYYSNIQIAEMKFHRIKLICTLKHNIRMNK